MSLSEHTPETSKNNQRHTEPGAFSSWGLIAGAIAGAIGGAFVGRALVAAVFLGAVLWIIGALIDRSRIG